MQRMRKINVASTPLALFVQQATSHLIGTLRITSYSVFVLQLDYITFLHNDNKGHASQFSAKFSSSFNKRIAVLLFVAKGIS